MTEKLLVILNTVLTSIGVDTLTSIDPSLDLRKDLEIDSISYAELIVRLEDAFNINVNDEGRVNTIGDIVNRLS